MSVMIDIYREEIAAAVSSGDDKWIARIAHAFMERCHYYVPWKIVNLHARVCHLDGVQAVIDIEFNDGRPATVAVGYINGKRRLTINGELVSCRSSADVVHALQCPCSFFDGIYYAIEGLAGVVKESLKESIANWDRDAKKHRLDADAALDDFCRIDKARNKAMQQLEGTRKQLQSAMEACKLAAGTHEWTMRPVDASRRIIDAQSMMAVSSVDFVTVHDAKSRLNGKSGVYFGWRISDGKCVYVGKAKNLGSRLHPGRDELIDCKITYVEMPESDIHTWELFYIWLHNPERNWEVRQSEGERPSRSPRRVSGGDS